MSKLRSMLHDPSYDTAVAEAHAFTSDVLGLRVGGVKSAFVVPEDKLSTVEAMLGDSMTDLDGIYTGGGKIFVKAGDLLAVRRTLVHEFVHRGMTRMMELPLRRATFADEFLHESLAGMGEVAFLDSLVTKGELAELQDGIFTLQGRSVIPEGRQGYRRETRDRYWQRDLPIPGKFWARPTTERATVSPSMLGAWSMTLAAEVSGIGQDELFHEAGRLLGRPVTLAGRSARMLAPDFNEFARLQLGEVSELNAVSCHLFDAAKAAGLVAVSTAEL